MFNNTKSVRIISELFFCENLLNFNLSCLHEATLNFHTHEKNFSRLSKVSVDGKQHLSEVMFSAVVEFLLLEKYPTFGRGTARSRNGSNKQNQDSNSKHEYTENCLMGWLSPCREQNEVNNCSMLRWISLLFQSYYQQNFYIIIRKLDINNINYCYYYKN